MSPPIGVTEAAMRRQPVSGATVLEDFEWGGAESVGDRYTAVNGSLSPFSVVSDSTIEGSYLLEFDNSTTNSTIIPSNGTSYASVAQGDPVFGCDLMAVSDGANAPRPAIGFGLSDTGDGYVFRVDPDNGNQFAIWTLSGGSLSTKDATGSYNPSRDVRYFPAIDWQTDDTIAIDVYEYGSGSYSQVDTVSLTDDTYTSGTIGFHTNSQDAKFDCFRKNPSFI